MTHPIQRPRAAPTAVALDRPRRPPQARLRPLALASLLTLAAALAIHLAA